MEDVDRPQQLDDAPGDADRPKGERRATKYPCIWCGFKLPPGKRRFHEKCRRENDRLRKELGTFAPGGNTCANPHCSNAVSRKTSRGCSDSCRKKLQRLRAKRRKGWRDAGELEAERIARCGADDMAPNDISENTNQ